MIAELISTGTELLLGQIRNSNAQYLAGRLAELGINVFFQTTVGDNPIRMEQVFRQALYRSDIIITTGGLGPTMGDITKIVSARVFGRTLVLHELSWAQIRAYFEQRGYSLSDNNIRQAMMPQGAIVLPNKRGTAPGVILEKGGKLIINLPGPPHEMQGMFEDEVVPFLVNRFLLNKVIRSRVLHCIGIGEATLEEEIKELLKQQENPTIALLVRDGEVHVRITACSSDMDTADELLDTVEHKLRLKLGDYIYGVNDDTLAKVVGDLLIASNYTVACAESCTGGMISSYLTDVPGSSRYFMQGIVSYSNEAKVRQLGVNNATIEQCGAVSEETAREMAAGIRKIAATDFAIATTGIAGPGGATEDKPVGLVFIGLATPEMLTVQQFQFRGERDFIRKRTVKAALEMLRRSLLGIGT